MLQYTSPWAMTVFVCPHHIARVPTRDLAARKKETYHWNPCHSEIPDFTSVLFPLVASNFTMTLDVLQIQTAFSIYCYVDISKSPQFGGIMKKKAEFYNNKYQIRPTIIFIKSKQRGKKVTVTFVLDEVDITMGS